MNIGAEGIANRTKNLFYNELNTFIKEEIEMDETMNTGVEVATEVSGAEEVTQEVTIEETSGGPSKGFVALVVGGIAAVAVGATIAINRHKKKKASALVEEDDEFEEDFSEDLENEEKPEHVEAEVVQEEKSEEKPAEKK